MKRKELQEEREEWRRREFRRSILLAAEKVIVVRGYSAMTMDDVAREAQISKATLYHYFRSKGELLLEILGNFFEETLQEVRRINRLRLSPEEKLKKGIHFYLRFNEEKENISRMFLMDRSIMEKMKMLVSPRDGPASEADRRFITKMKTKRKNILDGVAEILKEGMARGKFRKMNVGAAVIFVESLLQGYCHVRLWDDRAFSTNKAAGIIYEFILLGIGKEDGAAKGASR